MPVVNQVEDIWVENNRAGSHHGVPDLLQRDVLLLNAMRLWVKTVRKTGLRQYPTDWFPSEVDCLKSRLFWRIHSGRMPLSSPPPTCFSCPWYEVVEIPGPHDSFDAIRVYDEPNGKVVSVAQCQYNVIKLASMDGEANAATVGFGPWQFRAWNVLKEYPQTDGGKDIRRVAHISCINPPKIP